MAYTSIIPVHRLDNALDYTMDEEKCSRSPVESSLERAVDEALNQDKSEQDLFQSAIGCTLESAFADMCAVKRCGIRRKECGLSSGAELRCRGGHAGAGPSDRAGICGAVLGGKFQVVVSTHLNTGHIHNHLVWNSVSMENGRKYRSNEKSYVAQIRRISDELCRKHQLSVIDTAKSERVARPYAQWLAEQNGKPTWKTPIQQDVDAAIAVSLTWKQFLRMLEQRGYTFRFNRKYATLKPPGRDYTVRFKALGGQYTPEAHPAPHPLPKAPYTGWETNIPGPELPTPHWGPAFPQAHRPAGSLLFLFI